MSRIEPTREIRRRHDVTCPYCGDTIERSFTFEQFDQTEVWLCHICRMTFLAYVRWDISSTLTLTKLHDQPPGSVIITGNK